MLPFVLFTVAQLGRKHVEIGGKNSDFFCREVRSTDLKNPALKKYVTERHLKNSRRTKWQSRPS